MAKILALPYGKWLVILCAIVIFITGFYQFYAAWVASFEYSFDSKKMNDWEKKTLRWLGRIGFFAWGIVYCMVAVLFYRAAVNYDPEQAGGLAKALNALREQPFGIWILGLTAGGLIMYGFYLLVLAYYHKVYDGEGS